ncbi:MAG: tRNA (guanosine(46)-N7)-methyltransferase TrmB [bacterium]
MESLRIIPDDWLNPLRLDTIFDPARPLEIDLGCGKGRFLLARAQHHPDVQFFGIDRMLRRIRKIDNRAKRLKLNNVRLLRMEGYYAVSYLVPAAAIDTYYVFFPDPWPKKKHHAHRLFNEKFIDALHRTLKPGGRVHVATDHLPYFEVIREALGQDARFKPIEPFVPEETERTDFELWYHGRAEIGRYSATKIG